MAVLTIPDKKEEVRDPQSIAEYLESIEITYEQWEPSISLSEKASSEEILEAYASHIDVLKQKGNYVAVDIVNIDSETENLEAKLDKFREEHWHDEDEVRFILSGHGKFYIHPKEGNVVVIQVEAGDLLLIPAKTCHWFDLCEDRQIKAIRLFQNISGWAPIYTGSKIERLYPQPEFAN